MGIMVFLAGESLSACEKLRDLLKVQPSIEVVGAAGNGREVVQQVEQLQPDVVIMDIAMPDLNGFETVQSVADVCPAAQVIVLSRHSTIEHVFRAMQAGARGYLLEEAVGDEAVDAVLSVHGGHHFLSQKLWDHVIDDYVRQHPASGQGLPTRSGEHGTSGGMPFREDS